MSNIATKPLDGYALNTVDGYNVVSPWVDMSRYQYVCVTAKLTGGTPNGTFTLEGSNDGNPPSTVASAYPNSAGSISGDPDDLFTIPNSSQTDNNNAVIMWNSRDGTSSGSIGTVGCKWLRVKYVAISNVGVTLNVRMHRKGSCGSGGF